MLVVTMTSNRPGSRISSAAMASTRRSSQAMSPCRSATRRAQARKNPSDRRSTLALWTTVTRLRRRARKRERRLDDALGAFPRDLADRQREVGRRHEFAGADMHGTVGVEPFGVLAHDHEIDVAPAARRQARPRSRRPDIGEQVEPAAQFSGRIEPALADRRIVVVRHRAEDDAGSRLRLLDHRVGNRGTRLVQRTEADIGRFVSEAESELPVGGLQHLDGGGDDFRADAVTRQHQESGRGGTLPAGSRLRQKLLLRGPRNTRRQRRGETHTAGDRKAVVVVVE